MPHRSFRALIGACALVLGLAGAAVPEPSDRAVFVQSYVWDHPSPEFGGFSALELDAQGRRFVALSDRATLWRGALLRDAAGRITGVQTTGPVALHDSTGKALGRFAGDSEGLAQAADGRLFVSFEGVARVAHYPTDAGAATRLPRPEAFENLGQNAALEALAVGPDGALYTLAEGAQTLAPVWRYRAGGWTQPFAIAVDQGWNPVAADFGPDGRFYLLERDFQGLFGFANRVRVFDIRGDRIGPGMVLVQTPVGRHDNLEGLSVWRDGSGAVRLTMISDDNFSPFQRTEIVEYRLRH